MRKRGEDRGPTGPAEHFPPGHFYSPIPALDEVRRRAERIWGRLPSTLPGIDFNLARQEELFHVLKGYYGQEPFGEEPRAGLRYHARNDYYPYGDAFVLYGLMRHLRPRRIIEVGSGFSSALMLDVNDLHFEGRLDLTFIEPNPERLLGLLSPADRERVHLIQQPVQELEPELFLQLEANDILFIDSSHVGKIGSDVNFLLFDVLPRLRTGVYLHFHDVFHPFEYPPDWVYRGRAWNEAYLLRAFLMFNRAFSVQFFSTLLVSNDERTAREAMPRCLDNLGGSLWLRRE